MINIGLQALRCLLTRLQAQGITWVGLAGATANSRAMSAYAKVGLKPLRDFVECGEQYRSFTINLDVLA